jgi:hypothetical protein
VLRVRVHVQGATTAEAAEAKSFTLYIGDMKRAGIQILTFLVLVYAESPLVIWTLYTIEKHDIVLFYTSACDTTSGRSYVEAIEDGSRGFHGTCSIVKVAESTQGLQASPILTLPRRSSRSVLLTPQAPGVRTVTVPGLVFRPPRHRA